MSALIADVVQQGDNFWANEDWKQDEGDDENDDSSFEEVDAKPDVFDSDFNDTEESGSEDEGSDADECVINANAWELRFEFSQRLMG